MVCVVEMVKVVLAVRDAGKPSLPYHLLREDFKTEGQREETRQRPQYWLIPQAILTLLTRNPKSSQLLQAAFHHSADAKSSFQILVK